MLPALIYKLQAVAVRVEDAGGVVARVVVEPHAGCAVVGGSCGHCGGVSRIDFTPAVGAATKKATRKILDWFHISMRLRPIEEMSRGMAVVADGAQAVLLKELLETKLPNVRHQMWDGQWQAALDRMGDIYRASAHLQNCSPASEV